jgi:hypothetical protein
MNIRPYLIIISESCFINFNVQSICKSNNIENSNIDYCSIEKINFIYIKEQ